MIDGQAGGHTFVNGECACGVKLVDVQWVTRDDVGKEGIAHTGKVTLREIEQIMMLADSMRARVCTVFGWS